jgi:serine/threonine protein kinase
MEKHFSIKQYEQTAVICPTGAVPLPLGSGTITQLLGKGGMASVYEIWNNQLEVHRAVKLLHPNCNIESQERFQTEIKITAKLHHPYIVEIHGVGEWNGLPYIEMEKADGVTLEELIHTRGALPPKVCIAIGLMVSKALEYAHNHEYVLYNNKYHGIIHRDLKPANIMVCKDGTVKLMDFGIARPTDISFHTIDGAVIGTLQYLSPEQLEGAELDVRTDIYSLGICIYEMACGHLAFPNNNISHLMSEKTKNKYKPLSGYDIKLPYFFVNIIQQCMRHDKNKRPQTSSILSLKLTRIYDMISNDKLETVVANFLATSSKCSPLPKKYATTLRANKILLITIILTIIILYANMIISRKSSKTPQKTASTMTSEQQSITNHDLKITNPSDKKSESSEKSTITVADKKVENNTGVHLQSSKKILLQVTPSNIIDSLKSKYDTEDLLLIAQKEIQAKNTSNVLEILNILDSNAIKSVRTQVIKSRALELLDYKAFSSYVLSLDVNEAELLLDKARVMLDKDNNLSSIELVLDRASNAPREIVSSENITREVLYYKAISSSRQFDITPDEVTWREASEAWYIVKKEMRNQPAHEYYKKADDEITRISAKYRTIKG